MLAISEVNKHPNDFIRRMVSYFREKGDVMLLESQLKGHRASHKNMLAANPSTWIKSINGNTTMSDNGVVTQVDANPWKALSEFRKKHKKWMFGYLGYDLKNYNEQLFSDNDPLIPLPDMYFFIPEFLMEWDVNGEIKVICGSYNTDFFGIEDGRDYEQVELEESWRIQKQDYMQIVKNAQLHIAEGDYYEINLSHPLLYRFNGDPFRLYKLMEQAGEVPFAAFCSFADVSVCCSSPERFLAKKGSRVWSQPIKGTRPRNSSDSYSKNDLLLWTEKEKAENLMIVDLVRNDLNHIAVKGTVEVKNLFEIQTFETVHQMVSTIECRVDERTDIIDIIKSCFPMGSMTGAPKISAMKAIENFESYKRGLYSGAIGYMTPDDDFDFNVVIRTAIIKDNALVYPVGGAITSDSVPFEEWEETMIKARALTNVFRKP